MNQRNIPRYSVTFHLGQGHEVITTDNGDRHMVSVAYMADSLKVMNKNLGFLQDPRFTGAYQKGMDSGHHICRPKASKEDIHIEYRVYMLLWAATHAMSLPGDFVECGVNTGIYSIAICEYTDFKNSSKNFYLFDTFKGIPESQMTDRERPNRVLENEKAYEECYQVAQQNFADYPNAKLVRGEVPTTLGDVDIRHVAYLHLDMNIAFPEAEAIRHFWPKVVPGGIIMLDDYAWFGYEEQKKAMDEFAAEVGVGICTLPTGQGMIIKGP